MNSLILCFSSEEKLSKSSIISNILPLKLSRSNADGQPINQSVYFSILEVTVNPSAENIWSRCDAQIYYSNAYQDQRSVFLCPDIPSIWNLHQLFQQKKSSEIENILFISSSQLNLIPEVMRDTKFWRSFENIYHLFIR